MAVRGSSSPMPKKIPSADRIIGRYGDQAAGPALICVAAQHGNETAGVFALQRTLRMLHRRRLPFRGEIVGLVGNVQALDRKMRFVEQDLNRLWTLDRIEGVRSRAKTETLEAEEAEQYALLVELDRIFDRSPSPAYVLDLHTFSADGSPFSVVSDTLRNRAFARQIPAPLILGLEEKLSGTLPEYVNSLGHTTMGFESGRHDDPHAIEVHESALWHAMVAAGNLRPHEIPEFSSHRKTIVDAVGHQPQVVEIRSRYSVVAGDEFRMKPGFRNFGKIHRGQVLAFNADGPILAEEDGLLVMPLYQGQGNDGFFIAKSVRPIWLAVSELLRRLRVDRIAHCLPGVRPHASRSNAYVVNPRVAWWYVSEVFHLLGYRKRENEDGLLVVSRREHDEPPT